MPPLCYDAAPRSGTRLLTVPRSAVPHSNPCTNHLELNLAKPNYRHQKKQKEQARTLRQAEKLTRRQAARADGSDAPPGMVEGTDEGTDEVVGAGTAVDSTVSLPQA